MYAGNLYVNKSRRNMEINFSNFRAKLWNCLKPDLCKHEKKTFQKPNSPIIVCSAWWWGWLLYVDVLMLLSKITYYH